MTELRKGLKSGLLNQHWSFKANYCNQNDKIGITIANSMLFLNIVNSSLNTFMNNTILSLQIIGLLTILSKE